MRTNAFAASLSLCTLLATTSCGLPFNNDLTKMTQAQEARSLSADPYTPDGLTESEENVLNYDCPSDYNVLPDWDWDFNGTGFYTVCPSRKNQADILIHGRSRMKGQLCVFPAEVAVNGRVYTKPDVHMAGNPPWKQCAWPAEDGIHLAFGENINYNAVFIVDEVDVKQMSYCLQTGVYADCPKQYAYGRFR